MRNFLKWILNMDGGSIILPEFIKFDLFLRITRTLQERDAHNYNGDNLAVCVCIKFMTITFSVYYFSKLFNYKNIEVSELCLQSKADIHHSLLLKKD